MTYIKFGKSLKNLYETVSAQGRAIPAVNVTHSSAIIAALEGAKKANAPLVIQFAHAGAHALAGKNLPNQAHKASIAGAIAGAFFVQSLAESYEVPLVLHTDHANLSMLPWIDGLLEAGEKFYKQNGKPLFSSHMIDLSLEPLEKNLEICKSYLEKLNRLEMGLEIELGATGGNEEGLDNTHIAHNQLYTNPEDVALAYHILSNAGENFTIAASFGNMHGAQTANMVQLKPSILKGSQALAQQKWNTTPKPLHLVFHGGSGCSTEEIKEAIGYGVVKINIDTDLQWAYWQGAKKHIEKHKGYMDTQLGNPEGELLPNKAYYEPKAWLRAGEVDYAEKLAEIYQMLGWYA